MMLEQRLAERTKLLSQLEQAKMQEQVSASLNKISEMAAPGNTPTLDEVRDKIERRYANALGQADLAGNSVQGRMLEVQKATRDLAGASRLEEIRAAMHPELSASTDNQAITGGNPSLTKGTPAVAADAVAPDSTEVTHDMTQPGSA
jgi:phage shock protein A